MTWLVMVLWESAEVVPRCLPQVPGWGSVNLSRLCTQYSPQIQRVRGRVKGEVDL